MASLILSTQQQAELARLFPTQSRNKKAHSSEKPPPDNTLLFRLTALDDVQRESRWTETRVATILRLKY